MFDPDISPPALTPEQWEELRFSVPAIEIWDDPPPAGSGCVGIEDQQPNAHRGYVRIPPEARHPLAALALHGQAYGFTWDDVDRLREAQQEVGAEFAHIADPEHRALLEMDARMERVWMLDLADRISDLLPPRNRRLR